MSDPREDILDRLVAVLSNSDVTAKRMAVSVHATERPAIVINDGDEVVELGKGGAAPMVVTLRPVLMIFAASATSPGTAINELRASAIRAVLTDTELAGIAGVNGAIKYLGCETGLYRGETMEADMALNFELTYVLKPADL
jgi:hypothetical protein